MALLPQACRCATRWRGRRRARGAGLMEVQLPLGLLGQGDAAVAAAFEAALAAGRGRVRLAVVDHIASFPPVTFPVRTICAVCRAAGARGAGYCYVPHACMHVCMLCGTAPDFNVQNIVPAMHAHTQ